MSRELTEPQHKEVWEKIRAKKERPSVREKLRRYEAEIQREEMEREEETRAVSSFIKNNMKE